MYAESALLSSFPCRRRRHFPDIQASVLISLCKGASQNSCLDYKLSRIQAEQHVFAGELVCMCACRMTLIDYLWTKE